MGKYLFTIQEKKKKKGRNDRTSCYLQDNLNYTSIPFEPYKTPVSTWLSFHRQKQRKSRLGKLAESCLAYITVYHVEQPRMALTEESYLDSIFWSPAAKRWRRQDSELLSQPHLIFGQKESPEQENIREAACCYRFLKAWAFLCSQITSVRRHWGGGNPASETSQKMRTSYFHFKQHLPVGSRN